MSATSTRPPTPGPSGRTAREGTFFSRAMRPLNTTMERFIPSSLVFTIVL
ncbi:MAG: short-chain fatty acid transporter, partial [Cutibacterium acnes]